MGVHVGSSENNTLNVAEVANRVGMSQAVEHVVTAASGNPLIGKAAGQTTNLVYSHVPGEIKAGAGIGGLLAINAGSHMIAMGTAGSIAAGTAAIELHRSGL